MDIQTRAHLQGVSIFQLSRLDAQRRIARRLRIADEADRLLAVYHGETVERPEDDLPF